jgi:hypothetical protein
MIIDATGPPDRRIMCSGTEIRYANAQLFNRLTVTKNNVYVHQDLRGIARGLRKKARGPADQERKLGIVNSAVVTN